MGDHGAGIEGSCGDLSQVSDILERLSATLEARKASAADSSYVASLYAKGLDAMLKKIAEEAAETIMAAKDGDPKKIVYETADLWFHTLILLASQGLGPQDVLDELARREGVSGHIEKSARSKQ